MLRIFLAVVLLLLSTPSLSKNADEALKASEAGDFSLARSILVSLNKNDPYVMYAWAVAYRNGGEKTSPDLLEALKWFEKSAKLGNKEAQYTLGLMYQKGDGVPFDPKKAIHFYKKASSQGLLYATFNLANRYYYGDIIDQNLTEALALYKKVAKSNIPQGERMVGLMYLKGEGTEQDALEARKWFYKAAMKGLASAQNNMAFLWYGQEGHPVDLVKAYSWFVVAFENGHPETDANYRAIIKPKLSSVQFMGSQKLIEDLTSLSKGRS